MTKTVREQYATSLKEGGYEQKPNNGKAWVFDNPKTGQRYYLGASGSLRTGKTKTSSVPVTASFKNSLLGIVKVSS